MIRKSKSVLLLSVIVMLTVCSGTAWSEGNFNIVYGQKQLDSDDWKPVDEPKEFGIMFDSEVSSGSLSFALDFFYARDDATFDDPIFGIIRLRSQTIELDAGVRKYWEITEKFKTYLGGGVAIAQAKVNSIDGTGPGIWFSGGAAFNLNKKIHIGTDLRYSKAKVSINGINLEAGGTHVLLFLGFGF